MIHVIAVIEVEDGKRDALVAEFKKILPDVQAEDGYLEYGPTIDAETGIERQMPQRNNVVTMVEKWRDVDALKAHLQAPHMNAFRERVKDIIKNIELYITEPAC